MRSRKEERTFNKKGIKNSIGYKIIPCYKFILVAVNEYSCDIIDCHILFIYVYIYMYICICIFVYM